METIIKLKGGHYATDPRLGRIPMSHKNKLRSLEYDIRKKPLPWDAPRSFNHKCDLRLDQGQNPSCTGMASTYMLAAKPVVVTEVYNLPIGNQTANMLYEIAKDNDEWPGDDYEGSSSMGAAKACMLAGKIESFRWALDVQTMAIICSQKKPIVVGTVWKAGMMNVDGDGFVHATGKNMGGHEYCITGYNLDGAIEYFICLQSWGEGWSPNSEFKISKADMELLLAQDGDCWIAEGMTL